MNNIENKIFDYMEKNGMLSKIRCNNVYVGVSGGADSMVLLRFLSKYADMLAITPIAVHVNHGIRGESADMDENCVKAYCQHNGISYYIFNAKNDPNISIPEHASEEWARNLRYNYFNQAIQNDNKAYIATAHTISDQCETMLFRLARGTGLKGLGGIHPIRDKFIRPLLGITRSEVEELADFYKLSYCTDETNLTDIYNRNKLRHTVMPVMKSINANAEKALSTACERLSEAQEFIESMRDDILTKACIVPNHCYSAIEIFSQHSFMRDQLIIWFLEKAMQQSKCSTLELRETLISATQNIINSNLTSVLKSKASEDGEDVLGVVQVSSDVVLSISNKYICIIVNTMMKFKEHIDLDNAKLGYTKQFNSSSLPLTLTVLTYTEFILECKRKEQLPFYCGLKEAQAMLDYVSNYDSSSTFKPAKRMAHKVRSFAKEVGVPYADRANLPVIYDVFGNIVYTYGLGFTDGWVPKEPGLVLKIEGLDFKNNS